MWHSVWTLVESFLLIILHLLRAGAQFCTFTEFLQYWHAASGPLLVAKCFFCFTLNPTPYTLKKGGSEKKGDFSEKIKYVVCSKVQWFKRCCTPSPSLTKMHDHASEPQCLQSHCSGLSLLTKRWATHTVSTQCVHLYELPCQWLRTGTDYFWLKFWVLVNDQLPWRLGSNGKTCKIIPTLFVADLIKNRQLQIMPSEIVI